MKTNKKQYVQAFISNLSYFNDFNTFKQAYINRIDSNIEYLLRNNTLSWSVPRWAHQDDIILFMYSKRSITRINKISKEVETLSSPRRSRFSNYHGYSLQIEKAKELYKQYGGKIVGFGKLGDDPSLDYYNYQRQTGATIIDIHILENPLSASEFTGFLRISQGGVTPVWGDWYEKIKQMIVNTNEGLPDYFLESVSMSEEQSSINKKNWLKENLRVNFNYKKEEEFRTFYVDYLLSDISDDGEFFTECACYKDGLRSPSFADYFISIGDKWLPVETKIDINIENDIDYQVSKYCDMTKVVLDQKKNEIAALEDLIQDKVLIIDERRIQMYDHTLKERYDISVLKDLESKKDIQELRKKIIEINTIYG